ncbi:hypothetical protein [Tolypothrix sp. VBCCA 56010]|uniref:hypothetical protein n=1 Tax=Tolypothrix sp. VBCCA 56010 TaxID=3137731 RepID=UPI003D7D92AE
MGHGAWGMEHGAWGRQCRAEAPDLEATGVMGQASKWASIEIWLYSHCPLPIAHCPTTNN